MPITFVLVANGSFAKVIKLQKKPHSIEVLREFSHPETAKKGLEIDTDRPGRSFQSAQPVRHAYETSESVVDHQRKKFAKEIADYLTKAQRENHYEKLVIVISPDMLGYLRNFFSQAVQNTITHELSKDLIAQNLKEADLIKKIEKDLNVVTL